MNEGMCKPDDIECLQKQKLIPIHTFVDKMVRKMTIKGCGVSFSEHNDAINSLNSIENNLESVADIKTVLLASLSKSSSCDDIFEKSWNELLLPGKSARQRMTESGIQMPPGMAPIVEKHIANMINKSGDIESMIVNEAEMDELLKQGKVKAGESGDGGGLSSQQLDKLMKGCKQQMGGPGGKGIGQCLGDINQAIKNMLDKNFDSRSLSKIKGTGNDVDQLIDQVSKGINSATEISNEDAAKLKRFVNDLRKFKDALKNSIDKEIPKMDITPEFRDGESERKFIDKFMRGAIDAWGHPEFVGAITGSTYFKSKIREGLKSLHTRQGHRETVRQRGKLLAARSTMMAGMKKGALLDLFYKSKPPKQKEDLVWLVDTSGSMSATYSFIQPIVDGMDEMGLKQKVFLGTEEGMEVKPHSNFTETMNALQTSGTQLSKAMDDIKPKVGSYKDKTLIVYSDMDTAGEDEGAFDESLKQVVEEGGKVLILNQKRQTAAWNKKYVDAVAGKEPIVEFENVDNFERMMEVLREAAPIIKR